MAAIVSGSSLGLLNSSLYVLGSQGALGQASQGRAGEQVFVNSSTGNLVIQNRDELLIGRGPDISILRTYNSQGLFDGDNNDNWRFGVYRKVTNLTGTVNTAGSTVTRVAEDGSESVYTFDATLGKYVCHDGGGSYDTLAFTSATQTWTWSWTDGTNQLTETYDAANGRLLQTQGVKDQDTNSLSFTYNAAGLITQVTDANGESTFLDYTGTDLTQLRTVTTDRGTIIRTSYAYDGNHRLSKVTTDLTPDITNDSQTYVVTYTYDDTLGVSKRVATLSQTDGTRLTFAYVQVGTDFRVQRITDANGNITTFAYTQGSSVPASANANRAVLSTTLTSSTDYKLVSSALTTPTVSWGTASLLAGSSTTSATAPQVKFDQNGNGVAVWALGTDLFYSTYSKSNNTWSAAQALDGTLAGNPATPNLSMSANGNALVTWVQNSNVYARRYIAGVWDGASTIPNLENLTGAVFNPVGAINDNGRAVVAFIQTNGTPNNLYANVFNGTAWAAASTAVDDITTANANSIANTTRPSVAIDPFNNATVLWLQKTGTQGADSLYFSRFNPSTSTWGTPDSTTLENTTTAATAESIAFDGNGNGIAIWLQGGTLFYRAYTRSTNTWTSGATAPSLATSVTSAHLSMSANGNGLVTWASGSNIFARRYAAGAFLGTAEAVESGAGAASSPVGSINDAGQAVVTFVQVTATPTTTTDVYANRYINGAWQSAATIESSGNSVAAGMTPSAAIDAQGNVNALWLQKNGAQTTDSVLWNRFNTDTTPYYTIQNGGADWGSVATAVYGSSAAAARLQEVLGNPALTPGNRLTGFQATLTVTTTRTVAPDYTVTATDTWSSIAQAVYGDTAAAGPLQAALGSPALSAGLKLTVPASLTFTPVTAPSNPAAISTTDTQTTPQTFNLNTGAFTGASGNALTNWATVGNISAPADTWKFYTIDVPAGQSELFVATSGGTGDADFYVRYGAAPDVNTFDASGFDSEDADEAALIQNPAAGTWYIGVLAFSDISGVQLQTHYRSGIASTTVLQPGIAASDLAGVHGTQRAFSFDVPAGTSSFTVSLTGQAGQDVDLYLRRGSPPSGGAFDFASNGPTENESISVNAPLAGTWFAAVEGGTNYSDTALVLHTNLGANTPPTVQAGAPKNVLPGAAVSLAATGSDAQGAVTYQWTQLSGPAVTLTGATSATASFTSPAVSGPTLLDFQVKVTDGQGATYTDIVHVVVAPASGAQSYTVKQGDSWTSIAIAFYGSDSVASPLQTALSNAPLTLGNILTGFPPTLPGTVTTTVTVPAYYTVPLGATWATVTQAVYGTSDANAQLALRDALGSAGGPSAPVVGSRLTPMPASIRYAGPAGPSTATTVATTVAPYYTVQPNDSWSNIALTVYGDSQAGGALQSELGGGTSPTFGAHLTVPQTLPYTRTVAGGMQTDITDPLTLGPTTMVTDAQGQLTQILMPAVGGVRQSVRFTYNANGDVTQITDARDLVTSYEYDANGNRKSERDAAGNTITRVFGPKNELQTETSYVVPDPDGAGAGLPGTPLTTRYVYDAVGHLRFVVSAEGRVSEYRYNGFGQRAAAIQYTGTGLGTLYDLGSLTPLQTPTEAQLVAFVNAANKTKTERMDSTYGARGQLATTTTYASVDASGAGVLDGNQSVTRYTYDQAGNLLNTIDGKGSSTTYIYDGLGRLTQTNDAAGHPPTTAFYDDANRRVELTSSNQLKTVSTYDAKGQLISVVQTAVVNSVTQVLGTTSYFYDADGRLRRRVDPDGISTHILYDAVGRKLATIDGTGTLTEYRYDADNNLTKTIEYATALTAAQLASLVGAGGNPTAVTLDPPPPGSGIRPGASDQDRNTWNAYDSANRLVKSVDELGFVTQYSYDGAGRPTDVKKFATPIGTAALGDAPTAASINPAGDSLNDQVTRNFYDGDGKLRGALDPEGYLVEYKYNAAGEVVESVAYSKATDPTQRTSGTLAQLIPVENASEAQSDIHTYTLYNAEGQVVGVVDGEGYLTESVYDTAGNKAQAIRYANKVAYTPGASLATLRSRVLNLPGAAGSYASTPDSPANSITGDIDLRAEIAPTDWTPSAVRDVIAKNIGLSSGFSYRLRLETSGAISIYWSEDGTTVRSATSTASVAATDGAVKWIRAALDVNNGQSGRTIKFFTSDDYNPLTGSGTWTQLGSVITQAVTTSIFNSAADLEIGASGGTDNPFSGKIYFAEVWNGVDGAGAVVAKFDPSADSASTIATSFTSSSSNRELWTLSGSAALSTGNAQDEVSTYTYTALNQLDTATDALGTRTKYVYNNVGNLTQTVIAQNTGDARTLNAQYDTQGLLKVEFSGASIATSYTYDADGRRISATDRNGNRTLFFYDSDGHLTHTIDALGEVTENKYNALGQVTQRVAYAARLSGTTLSNLNGGLVVNSTVTSDVAAIANAAFDSATSYTYTLRGQVASATDPLNQSTTNYTYDADGDLIAKTEAVGKPEVRNTRYVYDRDDRLVYTVDASGGVTKNEYDAEGRVARTIAYTTALSDFSTLPATPTAGDVNSRLRLSPGDQALTHVYDRDGREVYTIDALGGVTQRIYDAAGNVIQRIGYAKTIPANTLPTVAAVSAALVSVSDAVHDNNVRLVYDTTNRLVYSIDGLGEVTRNDYDARDNVVRTTLYDKALTAAQLAGLGSNPTLASVQSLVVANTAVDRIEQRVFDIDDRLVYTIDSLGFVEKNDYDALGQVIRTTRYAQAIPVSTPATLGGVAAALAANANRVGVRGMNLPGAGTFASTPSSAANSVTGDIDLRVLLNPDSWTPANAQALLTKSDGALHVDYGLRLFGSTGKLEFVVNVTDTSNGPQQLGSISTVGTGFAPGSTHWVRATRSASTGDVKFYTSDTYDPNTGSGTWAPLGATLHTTPGAIQVTVPTLQVGSKDAPFAFKGKIYYADVRNVIDGTTVAVKFNPTDAGDSNAQSFASSSSAHETWTLSGGATLDSPSLTENQADTFAYDAAGRLVYHVDGHGQVTRNDYDASGNVIKATRYATQVGISSLGAIPTLASVQSVVSGVANAALDHVEQRVFDADNRLVYKIDALGFVEKNDYDALGQVIRTTRYAQAIPVSTPATLGDVVTALAANANRVGVRGLNLPGAAGTFASTPSSAANSVTGDIDLRVLLNPDSWTPANAQALITKSDGGLDVDYGLRLFPGSTGKLQFVVNVTSTSTGPQQVGSISTVGTGFAQGSTHWVRATRSASTGDVKFYTSDAYDPNTGSGTWAPLGATLHTTPGALQVTAPTLQIGSKDAPFAFKGKIYYADVRNVIDGTMVAVKFNPAEAGDTNAQSFASSSSAHETWTLSGGATLDSPSLTENQADTFAYDAAGHLVYRVDGHGEVTRNDYDAAGDVTRTTDYASLVTISSLGATPTLASVQSAVNGIANAALDHVEQRVLDAGGHLLFSIDAAGFVTQRSYDGNGNMAQEVRYANALQGSFTPGTAPQIVASAPASGAYVIADPSRDQARRFVYDAADRAIFVIDAANFVTRRFYDAQGRLVKEVRYANAMQGGYTPNAAPQILAPTAPIPASGPYVVTDPIRDRTSYFIYDADGRLRFTSDPKGYLTERRFDAFGQEIQRIRYADTVNVGDATATSLANSLPGQVPSSAEVEETHYDNVGRVLDTIDGNGIVTRLLYDAFGDPTDKIEALGRPEQRTTRTTYDALGRLTGQTTAFGTADASTKRFQFDAFGNQIAYIDPLGIIDPAGHTTFQAFDALGRMLSSTDPMGGVTRTDYDAFGNPVRAIDPNGNAGYLYYDQRNLLVAQLDPQGDFTEYQYDAAGNKTTTIRHATRVLVMPVLGTSLASVRPASSLNDQITTTTYDRLGRAIKIVDAEGHAELFGYDRDSDNVDFHQDKNGNVTRYDYDAVGNKLAEHLPIIVPATASRPEWQSAQLIEADDSGAASQVRLAFDAVGNGVAVWMVNSNVYANRYIADAGKWQGAQLIGTSNGQISQPALTVDAQGNAIAVWISAETTGSRIAAVRYAAATGVWQALPAVEIGTQLPDSPRIAFDAKGNATAVWIQAGAIHARRYDAVAGAWQADQTIGTGAGALDLALDAQSGDAVAVWTQPGATSILVANRYVAGTWQGAQNIATNATVSHPQVAIDSQGNAIAVFTGSTGMFAVRCTASIWQAAQLIGTGTGTDNAQIAFDAQGNAIAVWETSSGVGINGNRYIAATGAWQGVQTLIIPSTGGSLLPQVAVDARGNAIAVWQQFEGGHFNIYASRLLAGASAWQTAQPIEGGPGGAINVQIAMDSQGSAIAAWEQFDGTQFSLTANRFDVATVVNRYEYDAFGNKITDTLAQGAQEARVTKYVYDKNNRLIQTNEPQVLAEQSVAAPPVGSFQVSAGGTASFTFIQNFNHRTEEIGASDSTATANHYSIHSSLTVSWAQPIIGFGDGDVVVVWKAGAGIGEFSSSAPAQATSVAVSAVDIGDEVDQATALSHVLDASHVFEVDVYKKMPNGDLLLVTSVQGNYSGWITQDTVDFAGHADNTLPATSQVPTVFQFTGQPTATPSTQQTMHLAYWSSSEDVVELDLKSYASGTFSGLSPQALVPGRQYVYEFKLFDANGDVINAGTGGFTAASSGVLTPTTGTLTVRSGGFADSQVFRTYDAAGNLVQEKDARSNIGYNYYDANGRLIGTVDRERYLRRYFYDAAGNLIKQRTYGDPIPGTGGIATLPDPADPNNFREAVYGYDANGLRIETSTQEVLIYDRANGLQENQKLVTSRQYDRNGNVVLETDANGNKTYTYYDKADRKIAQVDPMGYLTAWRYDPMGNATRKTQFANKIPANTPISTSSDPATLVTAVGTSLDDRVCLYAYDRMNRLISETTLGVDVSAVTFDQSLSLFGTTTDPVNVKVAYSYDNTGNLVTKVQNNVRTDFAYDGLNRLAQETDPAFTDFNGATVRSTKRLFYDGVGNLSQVVENGNTTSYDYDPHGNLTRQVDANGNATRFYYDLNGNATVKRTRHINADGTAPTIDALYVYDKLNRQTSRTETRNFTYGTRYDAYGEITGEGLRGGSQEFEEYEEYDRVGRLIKTNKDDGVDRAYLYDANGNQTATIRSGVQDIDIRSLSISQIAKLPVSTVQRTESSYDKKNELTGVFQAPIAPTPGAAHQDVWVDALDNPFAGGTMTQVKGTSANFHFFGVFSGETAGRSSHTLQVAVSWAPVVGYGDGNIRVIFATSGGVQNEDGSPGSVPITAEATLGPDATSVFFNPFSGFYAQEFGSYTIGIYKETFAGLQLVAGSAGTFNWTGGGVSGDGGPVEANVDVQNPDRLQFTGQRSDAQKLRLWLWPIGQPKGGFTDLPPQTAVTTDLGTSTLIAGQFAFPLNGTPPGQYNYEYQTLDGADNVLDNVKGTVAIGGNSWQGAQLIETNANPVSAQQVAVDKQGNAIAVWIQSDGVAESVYANLYVAASGAWLGAQPIETSSIAASDVQVAFDAQGNAFAVWNQGGVMANRYRAGTWQGVQPVPGSANKPQIALDAQGNAIVVSQIQSGTRQVFANRFVVSPDGTGAWQASQVIGSGAFGDLKIASDAKGNAIALWRNFDGLSDKLVVSRYDVATGFWQAPQTIATRSFIEFPKIAFDAQGNAMVVWDGGGVFAIRYLASTGTWQGMLPVNANSDTPNLVATGEIASIAFDAQGNAMAVWDQVDGAGVSNIWANRFVVSPDGTGAWQSPRLIENAPGLPFRAQVTVDALGNATAVWTQSDGTTTSVYANHYSVLTDTWQGAQLIESDPRVASGLAIAGNGAGEVMAVWGQSDLFANHYVPFTKLARTIQDVPANSTTAALINAGRTQVYNAFGQVSQEKDAYGRVTDLRYNTRGDLIQKTDPAATYTNSQLNKVLGTRSATSYFYDYLGRLVGTRDPEGHATAQIYDGAGHLLFDINPDGTAKQYKYDVNGDRRRAIDEVGLTEQYSYDGMHHVTEVIHPTASSFIDVSGLDTTNLISVVLAPSSVLRKETYSYDENGRRISHTDARGGIERTFYDGLGRVIKTVDAAGVTTRYDYFLTVADPQRGRVGTKSVTTEDTAQGLKTLVDVKDAFGRLLRHSDLGGHQFTYTYNKAGWLIQQYGDTDLAKTGIEQDIRFTYYQNGLLRQTLDKALKTRTGYEYDLNGNVTFEGYEQETTRSITYYQTARASYDELNRVAHIEDPRYTIDYEYDRNGNRRHILAKYNDRLNGTPQLQDYWYDYDASNRVTITQGKDGGHVAVLSDVGAAITYTKDGQRDTATYFDSNHTKVKETYGYADGLLTQTTITNAVTDAFIGFAGRTYDAAGRVFTYSDTSSGPSFFPRSIYTYTADGKVSVENNSSTGISNYYYDNSGTLFRIRDKQAFVVASTIYSYDYWDAPKQTQIQIQVNGGAPGQQPGFSNFRYDVNGHLTQVTDFGANGSLGGGDDRILRYVLDARGLVLERNEVTGTSSSKTQAYYYLNGVGIGDSGFVTSRTDYASVLASRGTNPKTAVPISSSDFGSNYQPINDRYPATTPGTYTLQETDRVGGSVAQTLRNVALAVWGDGSLWYLLADANALDENSQLEKGQTLVIPNVVTNVHNNVGTYKVYDAGEAIGDTSPTLPDPPPPPQQDRGCSTMELIVIVVIAAMITIATEGAALEYLPELIGTGEVAVAATPILAAAIGAAAGSAAAQMMMVSAGLQDHFRWSQVALAAVGAAVGAGAAAYTEGAGMAEEVGLAEYLGHDGSLAFNAAVNNMVTQGIGKITGWQHTAFSWRSAAVSAAGAVINSEVTDFTTTETDYDPAFGTEYKAPSTYKRWVGDFGAQLTANLATGVATQFLRQKVGNNGKLDYGQIFADSFSGTLGDTVRSDMAAQAYLLRQNAQDAARDVEGSSIASDSRRTNLSDHERLLLEDPDYLRRAIQPEPYQLAATGADDLVAFQRARARALLTAADSSFFASVGNAGRNPDLAFELYLNGQARLSDTTSYLNGLDEESRQKVLTPSPWPEPRGGYLFAANNFANMSLEDIPADESRGAGNRFLSTYFTKKGMTIDERLSFIASRPDAALVFAAAIYDLGKPQPIDGPGVVRTFGEAVILGSLPWTPGLKDLSNRVANITEFPEGLAYRLNFPQHLAGPDGFKTGLRGTHNLDNAIAALDSKGAAYSVTPTSTAGIAEVKYTYMNPATGKIVEGRKTVYDPTVYSDQIMLNYATKAGQLGWEQYLQNMARTIDVSHAGVNFRVHINGPRGNAYVGSVYPIR